jgi:predicted nucleotidyltransferase
VTEQEFQAVLDDIVRRITARFSPEQIILFGSYARGQATPDSDVDLLVVMEAAGSERKRAIEIDKLLIGVPLPTDVIVVTSEHVRKYHEVIGTIVREAVREGRVLHARAA